MASCECVIFHLNCPVLSFLHHLELSELASCDPDIKVVTDFTFSADYFQQVFRTMSSRYSFLTNEKVKQLGIADYALLSKNSHVF